MKKYLLICLIIPILGCQIFQKPNSALNQDKNLVHSYYKQDTLHIVTNDNKEILKLFISFNNSPTNKSIVDTLFLIGQYQVNNKLFIAISEKTETIDIYTFYGLIDLSNNQWLVKQKVTDTLFNGNYISSSSDDKYHLFLSQWKNDASFKVFDSKNRLLKQGFSYYSCDTNQLKWQIGDKFYYFSETNQDSLPKDLAPIDINSERYARKYFWFNSKDSFTNEYKVVNVE